MNFTQSVNTCLREKYFKFEGRASRSEFWWFVLFYSMISLIFSLLFIIFGGMSWLTAVYEYTISGGAGTLPPSPGTLINILLIISSIFWLYIIIPSLAVATRRLHDRNLSGWFLLIYIFGSLIPWLGFLVVIGFWVLWALPGNEGSNKYGASPI